MINKVDEQDFNFGAYDLKFEIWLNNVEFEQSIEPLIMPRVSLRLGWLLCSCV